MSKRDEKRGDYSVTRRIRFCYGHRLLRYRGKCRHLHGHNGLLEVTLRAEGLDSLGMVMDFEKIKRALEDWVDRTLDHKLLLNEKDPLAAVLRRHGEPLVTLQGNPTAEAITRLVYEEGRRRGLAVAAVRLWETSSSCAEYGPEP